MKQLLCDLSYTSKPQDIALFEKNGTANSVLVFAVFSRGRKHQGATAECP